MLRKSKIFIFFKTTFLKNYNTERDNKVQKCFSCPGDCKELSKKTK